MIRFQSIHLFAPLPVKKVFLSGAALLAFAAMTHAQIFQQGNTQFAQQQQNGPDQTGVISQQGTPTTNYGNYAITFQGQGQNIGPNQANINQNSGPTTSASGVVPPVIGAGQGSQGNRGAISQNGGGNRATINQNGGPDGISGGGLEQAATLGLAGGDGNFGGILQQGVGNAATVNQNNNSRRNFGEVYQHGENLTGSINQSSGSVSNRATINQGFANNVGVAPITGSTATINQGTLDRNYRTESIGNTANITQTVSNVKAIISQGSIDPGRPFVPGRAYGSTATLTQSAFYNGTSTITQGADSGESIGSRATLIISGENNLGENNLTNNNRLGGIIQGSGPTGLDNGSTANITQAGRTSSAYISQGNYGQTESDQATINQSSTVQDSWAEIYQALGAKSSSRNDQATILQTGQRNFALIYQNSGFSTVVKGSDNVATINQINDIINSQVSINQGVTSGSVPAQAIRNQATVNQISGNRQYASIGQGTSGPSGIVPISLTPLSGPDAVLGLIAIDNRATITQSGSGYHNATILQSGRNNVGTINQSNGSYNTATIIQTANSRFASAIINQSSSGSFNIARAFQFAGSNADGRGGFGNQIEINQIGTGSYNTAIAQQGFQGATDASNDNFIRFTQNGSSNTAKLYQQGNNNFADVTQNGNGNVFKGEGDSSYASQIGYGNRLTLVQNAGPNGGQVFSYTQIGNNNTQVVTQSPQ